MLKDYKGACHIHTECSGGNIPASYVIKSAQDAGLDFVILSDHNSFLPKQNGWEGWHDNLLVIAGMEVSPCREGHFLVLDTQPLIDNGCVNPKKYKKMTSKDGLDDIVNNGGTVFIVHPLGKQNKSFRITIEAWHNWEHNGFAGIESWSYLHDWIDELKLSNLWCFYKNPSLQIKGPDPKLLSLWDELGQKRKVSGISGLDAHYRKIPFAGRPFFNYEELFKTIHTHVLVDTELAKSDDGARLICDAQKDGKCYVSFDLLADATGFSFIADSGDKMYQMGDEVYDIEKEICFDVKSPHHATIKLLHNGKVIKECDGDILEYSSAEKGVYRAEAYIENWAWVFTNPIYIR